MMYILKIVLKMYILKYFESMYQWNQSGGYFKKKDVIENVSSYRGLNNTICWKLSIVIHSKVIRDHDKKSYYGGSESRS